MKVVCNSISLLHQQLHPFPLFEFYIFYLRDLPFTCSDWTGNPEHHYSRFTFSCSYFVIVISTGTLLTWVSNVLHFIFLSFSTGQLQMSHFCDRSRPEYECKVCCRGDGCNYSGTSGLSPSFISITFSLLLMTLTFFNIQHWMQVMNKRIEWKEEKGTSSLKQGKEKRQRKRQSVQNQKTGSCTQQHNCKCSTESDFCSSPSSPSEFFIASFSHSATSIAALHHLTSYISLRFSFERKHALRWTHVGGKKRRNEWLQWMHHRTSMKHQKHTDPFPSLHLRLVSFPLTFFPSPHCLCDCE